MEKLNIEGSPKTPTVSFDSDSGKFLLAGRSIPENAVDFYKPVYKWLDDYVKEAPKSISLDVKLEYFNTSSSKCLLDVFKKVELLSKQGSSVEINWFYEEDDEDMLEAGEDYDVIIDIPFQFNEVEEL